MEKILKLKNQKLFCRKEIALELFGNPMLNSSFGSKTDSENPYPIGQIGSNIVYVNPNIKDDNIYDELNNILEYR